ncbi:hypothetical protein LguiA_031702 [Lonicera macranthoides]
MERKVRLVCMAIGFLGLLSAALGLAAEALRIKDSQVIFTSAFECEYPRGPALALGLTAAVALTVAKILLTVSTRCMCCKRGPHQSDAKYTLALVSFIISWFTFIIAFLLFVTGAALNERHGDDNMFFVNYYCYVVKPGIFAVAAFLSLASVLFGIVYYLNLNSAKIINDPWVGGPAAPNQTSNIAMGQPQIPTRVSQDPVFVHEDTYIRRQLA